jgi:diguanylate cyclase (GGDEF)-like protein
MRRLLACVLVLVSAGAAAQSLDVQLDGLVREGFERPAPALGQLRSLLGDAKGIDERRRVLQAIGSVEAQTGRAQQAGATAERLLALAADDPSGRAIAASHLVRALVAENAGQPDVAAALAQSALPAFQAGCPPHPESAAPAASVAASGCDYRAAWRVLHILERRAASQGVEVTQTQHAQAALALAQWGGDALRQSANLGALALLAQMRGEPERATKLMAQARRLAEQAGDTVQRAHISDYEGRLAFRQGDPQRALQFNEEARALAALAQAPRLEARLLNNLSDAYARVGRPADALAAAERALPVVRQHDDQRLERVLMNNIGIAKIGLGRIAEGKQDLARLLELWRQSGDTGHQAQTLLEFGEALAAAGDARGALELYHLERALSDQLRRTNREVALKELQARNDAEARQRDIELLARDNALKSEALAIRDLRQRMWWLMLALMVLATVIVTLLYRRVRQTHRRLAASHAQLQVQSERDPLTGLANRRHFQHVMAKLAAQAEGGGFEGALLLVDVDHFKRINDVGGHAAGDEVLVQVARRLEQAVRGDDLVVRWGGEEFLVVAPRAAPEQAEQMAQRVLGVLAREPVQCGERRLRITASIGYGRFPLPPYNAPVPWEQAVHLADMALYLAKSEGRNRAVGIAAASAPSAEALRAIDDDFDGARRDGRVTLTETVGPEPADIVRVA